MKPKNHITEITQLTPLTRIKRASTRLHTTTFCVASSMIFALSLLFSSTVAFSGQTAATKLPVPLVANLSVPGNANIFGAGHSVPPAPAGQGAGALPPVVNYRSGQNKVLTIDSVKGAVTFDIGHNTASGADGRLTEAITFVAPVGRLSGIRGPGGPFLCGVFLDSTEPANPAPTGLDFTPADRGVRFNGLAPAMRQVFFIGDGLTPTGRRQEFTVPEGATRLYLGLVDSGGGPGPNAIGYYSDNGGSFSVSLRIVDATPQLATLFHPKPHPQPHDVPPGDPVMLQNGLTAHQLRNKLLFLSPTGKVIPAKAGRYTTSTGRVIVVGEQGEIRR